jgi:hypothetical protein
MNKFSNISRRTMLQTAAAGTTLLAAPNILLAATSTRYVRKSMTDPAAVPDMESYRKAVGVMWNLPADHPHNWFRMAMTHILDCPHGNWWFCVWHRGYIGYFEQIIRKYSGDENFALPYWDWSADPYVANSMFNNTANLQNALDPTSTHFPPDWSTFDAAYQPAIANYWNALNSAQRSQQATRHNPNFATFYRNVQRNFTTPSQFGRSKTATSPYLTGKAADYVVPSVIETALQPAPFTMVTGDKPHAGFNSPESPTHHQGVGSAIMEGYPHNNVHNNLGSDQGGWMPSLLSSVDPIFFLHHCNIDRLWDVWTRKQLANGDSAEPTKEEQLTFYPEEFLFFHDVNGEQVLTNTTAKDYMHVDRWEYSYTNGTGSEVIPSPQTSMLVASAKATGDGVFTALNTASAGLAVTPELTKTLAGDRGRERHVAHISFQPPSDLTNARFNFFLSPKGDAPDTSADSPEFAGSFEFFGMTTGHDHPHTVMLDISAALDKMEAAGLLQPGGAVDVSVVAADGNGIAREKSASPLQGTLKSVAIETI